MPKEVTALVRFDDRMRSQAVAAYKVAGGYVRAVPILCSLWGLEESELPARRTIQTWVATGNVDVDPQHLADAERAYKNLYAGALIDLQQDVIASIREKIKDPKEKLFNVNGTLKILGDMLTPILAPKRDQYVDMRGAMFITKKDRQEKSRVVDGELVRAPGVRQGDESD